MPGNTGFTFYLLGLCSLVALIVIQTWAPHMLDLVTQTVQSLWNHNTAKARPPIIMSSMNAFGHQEKIATIAKGLVALGYPITFVTGAQFRSEIESIGATFVPLDGSEQMLSPEDMATFLAMPPGLDAELFAIRKVFLGEIPNYHRTVQRVMVRFRSEYGAEQPIVVVGDSSFPGFTPAILGAPNSIRPDAFIGIGLAPLTMASNDSMPFRSGLLPDTSPQSKQIHWQAHQDQAREPFFAGIQDTFDEALTNIGAEAPFPTMWDAFSLLPDHLLQLGIPEFEYPRSDLRPNVEFIGALSQVGLGDRALPEWWDDVLAAGKASKRIILVSAGSVDNNPQELIIPTLNALKDRNDLLVITTTVTFDTEIIQQLPSNARVAKFIPFDLLFPFVSVYVTNGGYGSVQQALKNGVPMVIAGVGQDKAQTGGLVEYVGVGKRFTTRTPGEEKIREAVEDLLTDEKYREKAAELREAYKGHDPVAAVERKVQEVFEEFRKA